MNQPALAAAAQMAFLHESVIVAGEEIAFNLPHRVQRDADDDQQACATEELRDQRLDAHAAAEKHRQDRQNRQEDSAGQRDTRHGVVQESGCVIAGADARNVATVLLQVIRNLDGIELVRNPEEREDQNHDAIDYDIRDAAILQKTRYPADEAAIGEEAHDHHRERKDRAREDYRHDSRIVDAQRKVTCLQCSGLSNARHSP